MDLAWLFPYFAGALGVVTVGGLAVRWSRRASTRSGANTQMQPAPAGLESRLDDELRDLD